MFRAELAPQRGRPNRGEGVDPCPVLLAGPPSDVIWLTAVGILPLVMIRMVLRSEAMSGLGSPEGVECVEYHQLPLVLPLPPLPRTASPAD